MMSKIYIVVEGHTELIFVRDFLLKYYEYNIDLYCYSVIGDNFKVSPFNNPRDSNNTYVIWNVGNDRRVTSFINSRQDLFVQKNADFVLGIRDMFSKEYKSISTEINLEAINKMISIGNNFLNKSLNTYKNVKLLFAIMEIEAWFLGINNLLIRYDSKLTIEVINEIIDLQEIDPETGIFNPSQVLENIFSKIGLKYDKDQDVVESLVKKISRNDYIELYYSNKCNSYNRLFTYLNLTPQ